MRSLLLFGPCIAGIVAAACFSSLWRLSVLEAILVYIGYGLSGFVIGSIAYLWSLHREFPESEFIRDNLQLTLRCAAKLALLMLLAAVVVSALR